MNFMPEITKLLGVEIGEEFKIKFYDGDISSCTYRFTDNSLNEIEGNRVRPYCNGLLTALLNGTDSVVKLHKPILDDVEKKYLSKVIRPFRDRIVYISKENVENSNKEYIYIGLWGTDKSTLPPFERETMYKGMIVGKRYHLKELGL